MPHPESEHGLRIQLSTALRERDAEKAALARSVENEKAWCAMAQTRERERDAANARADDSAQKLTAMEKYHEFAVTQSQKALAAAQRENKLFRDALQAILDMPEQRERMCGEDQADCCKIARAALAAPGAAARPQRCTCGHPNLATCADMPWAPGAASGEEKS